MWVFCCGMYRSASTLQFQITSHLVKEAQAGQQIGWIDADRFSEVRSSYQDTCGYKVIKVHQCTDLMITEFLQGNAIGIYSFRDIRDVYASMMKQRLKTFEFLWDEGFLKACLDNYKRWTVLPNVLVSKYEFIIENPAQEVKRIAEHLGILISRNKCQEIAENYAIRTQKERIMRFKKQLLATPLNPNDHREIVDYRDEEHLLHLNHIDAVKAGRWRKDLSVDEINLIQDEVENWCEKNEYDPLIFLS